MEWHFFTNVGPSDSALCSLAVGCLFSGAEKLYLYA